MNSDNLKEKIEQILCDGNDDLVPPISYQDVLDQLLQLFQDYAMGCVPEEEVLEDLKGQIDYGYMQGYNQCRQDILDNLEGKS